MSAQAPAMQQHLLPPHTTQLLESCWGRCLGSLASALGLPVSC